MRRSGNTTHCHTNKQNRRTSFDSLITVARKALKTTAATEQNGHALYNATDRTSSITGVLSVFVSVLLVVGAMSGAVVAATDEQEPNDDFDTAQAVSEGNVTGKIINDESDFFKIEANTTDALDIAATPESAELSLTLYGPDRTKLESESNFGGNKNTLRIPQKAPETGTYYIQVSANNDISTNYTLDVEKVTPTENDAFAPNDNFSSAATIPEGFSEATVWGGESDFFKIEANTTDALDIAATPESAELSLTLYGPDRTKLESKSNLGGNTKTLRIPRKAPETGTYYIEVTTNADSVTTNYTLDVEKVTPTENDAFAPNDNFSSAATISEEFTNAKVWGGESDFYRVGLNASEGLEVAVTPESDEVALRVYAPDRTQLEGKSNLGGNTNTLQSTIKASQAGIYYVEVAGGDETATTEYRLQSNKTGVPERFKSVIPRYDKDDSGTIDDRELLAALADYPEQVSPTDLLDLLAVYDPDG